MTQKSYTEAELIEGFNLPCSSILDFSTNTSVSASLSDILLYHTLFTDTTIPTICLI